MKCRFTIPAWLACWPIAAACAAAFAAEPVAPLLNAHAHNDYEHKRPLFNALDCGFCSVEADVHLVDGQLLVAHERAAVKPGRTLQALYLDPLRERVNSNGGRVYAGGPEFTLLVEIKGEWRTSYPVLREILKQYADMLTTFRAGSTQTNAIRVIITGHRAKEMFHGETARYAALDGDLADLESGASAALVPWISSNWRQSFKWRGKGALPEPERARLKAIVDKAHQQGRRVRFWGAPDQPVFWGAMLANGVDLINTDNLEGARDFLRQHGHQPMQPQMDTDEHR
ncbi:MAG TPA: phosphatidylinositol-specific phospholipase C/glycerophosphodiester phosphodiesterase family protein [Candidatus Acidoferrum sp.]|nr:phosphatidylinositol-specific phospholipase C/glycerophosphodiester phosphodiesterase family protein [Candidatus Acidoferrum sp.]